MRARKAVAWMYRGVWLLQLASSSGAVIVGAALKADPGQQPETPAFAAIHDGLLRLQTQSLWLLPALVLLSALLAGIKKLIGDPWVWEAVQHHLDSLQQSAFEIKPGDALHHHRVTLFRHVGWHWRWARWPWSGWLVPVSRSGHTTQHSNTVFLAPDDADKAEGVAGKAWATRQTVQINDLPDLTTDVDELEIAAYARSTGCTTERIRKWRPPARSFCGIPVEVRSKLWGVLVLDSRSEKGIKQTASNLYGPMSNALAKLLERI